MQTDKPVTQLSTKKRRIVLLPIGSCEQHGPYLPIDTDLRIAQLISNKVACSFDENETLLLPPIPFSSSWEHKGIGTISLNISTLGAILHDIARSLKNWNMPMLLILVNWHGGNSVLDSLATEITATENIPTAAIGAISIATQIWQEKNNSTTMDIHAGALETSIIGAYWPHLLSGINISSDHKSLDIGNIQIQTAMQALGIHQITTNGIWGDPENANTSKGEETISLTTIEIKREIEELRALVENSEKGN